MPAHTVLRGDCCAILPTLAANSLDGCVTDPPYGLSFMGAAWDHPDNVAFKPETWAAVLRVLKPGAHLFAFGGTRKSHRLTCSIEDAGFEIRDSIAWIHGQGFPKGQAQLKPAIEPIVMARKPLDGTLAANIAKWGAGALNIDACRVAAAAGDYEHAGDPTKRRMAVNAFSAASRGDLKVSRAASNDLGRWPANVIHDGSDEVVGAFPETGISSGGKGAASQRTALGGHIYGKYSGTALGQNAGGLGDSGSAARFFYCPKPTRRERGAGNDHPTVKPVRLISYLIRLGVPVGGTVLDPFLGSGTTLLAARAEGRRAIGIEAGAHFADIAERRLAG